MTELHRFSESGFTGFAQWPRWHVFYGRRDGKVDSAMVAETLRQLTVLISHSGLGVPLGQQFLMPGMAVNLSPAAYIDSSVPADVTITARISGVRTSARGVGAFNITADFHVEGRSVASGEASARIVDPAVYGRYRKGQVPDPAPAAFAPVDPARVGHNSVWNVVLGAGSDVNRWPLRFDISNPVLFDHPLDHVPGVLLIEAARQALRLTFGDPTLDLMTFRSTFFSVAELGDDAAVVVEKVLGSGNEDQAVVSVEASDKVLMRTVARIMPRQEGRTGYQASAETSSQRDQSAFLSNQHA